MKIYMVSLFHRATINKQLKHGPQSLRGYAQQELTILMIFLLVLAHKST